MNFSLVYLTIILLSFLVTILLASNNLKSQPPQNLPSQLTKPAFPSDFASLSPIASASTQSLAKPSSTTYLKSPNSTNNSFILSDLKYPNSTIISENNSNLTLENSDDPTIITNWYKDKIRQLNMTTKSFVSTNNNNNILNKLVGSKANLELTVDISKQNGQNTTQINLSYE